MGNYLQLTGSLAGAFGEFEQDKSNLIILVSCYLYSSLIDQKVFLCQITLVIGKIKSVYQTHPSQEHLRWVA